MYSMETEGSSDGSDGNTARVSPFIFHECLHASKFNMFLNVNCNLYRFFC
jgi:hypothetical protein